MTDSIPAVSRSRPESVDFRVVAARVSDWLTALSLSFPPERVAAALTVGGRSAGWIDYRFGLLDERLTMIGAVPPTSFEALLEILEGPSTGPNEADDAWQSAIHEAGHAIADLALFGPDALLALAISRDGSAGGVTWVDPIRSDTPLYPVSTLAAGAAERLLTGVVCARAENDETVFPRADLRRWLVGPVGDPPDEATLDAAMIQAQALADRLVGDRRRALEVVARALLSERELWGPRLRALIATLDCPPLDPALVAEIAPVLGRAGIGTGVVGAA